MASIGFSTDLPSTGGGGGGGADPSALKKLSNLSDLSNITTARTNLGLGTAATFSDTLFLKTANNLSDLANTTTARTNLVLGTSDTPQFSTIVANAATINTVPIFNGTKTLISSSITSTELSNLSGVTSNIQTQINSIIVSASNGNPQRLSSYATIANTDAVLYTVPVGNRVINPIITICNLQATTATYRISHEFSGTSFNNENYILFEDTLLAGETVIINLIGLQQNETIMVRSDQIQSIFSLYGGLTTDTYPRKKLGSVNLSDTNGTVVYMNGASKKITNGSIIVCNRNATAEQISIAIRNTGVGLPAPTEYLVYNYLVEAYSTYVLDNVFALDLSQVIWAKTNSVTGGINIIAYGIEV